MTDACSEMTLWKVETIWDLSMVIGQSIPVWVIIIPITLGAIYGVGYLVCSYLDWKANRY